MRYKDWRQLPPHSLEKGEGGRIQRVAVYDDVSSKFLDLTESLSLEPVRKAFPPESINSIDTRTSTAMKENRIASDSAWHLLIGFAVFALMLLALIFPLVRYFE